MVIVDYSGTCVAGVSAFFKDLEKGSEQENRDLIRHIILQSIVLIRKKYNKRLYGEIVIACDGRDYWRRDQFPQYKGDRKKIREESKIDWNFMFGVFNEVRQDLMDVFPYRVVLIDRAEADDIIGVLTKYTQTEELVKTGMIPEPQNVVAVSEDLDFVQLHKYENFRMWMPRKKKMHDKMSAKALLEFTRIHITKAGDDGIPNVLSADDVFVTEPKTRQTTVSAKRLAEFIELGKEACRTDVERRNWDRNTLLIDLDNIPKEVSDAIIEAYKNAKVNKDRTDIFNYLIKHRCRQLLNSLEDF